MCVTEVHSGDQCDLSSTLCKYDLRKVNLFVLSWAWVRQVRRGSISSEPLMCGEGVLIMLLLPLVARCLETIDVCISHIAPCNICVASLQNSPLVGRNESGIILDLSKNKF